jgi:galactokinase
MNDRLSNLAAIFQATFGEPAQGYFRSAGRLEILGNHTDHQGGNVLVGSIDMTMLAAVSKRPDETIVLESEGYPPIEVDLRDLKVHHDEYNRTSGIIRGVAYRLSTMNYVIGGLNITMNSTIRPGSGVSSSAAFEILLIKIFSTLYNDDRIDPVTMAKIAQYAENVYFGKPSGLLDQMGIALGGINYIEFADKENPFHEPVPFPFPQLHFLILNTGGSHTDLTSHYARVKDEMKVIAGYFKKDRLIEVEPKAIQDEIVNLLNQFGIRPVNRALHFFAECERVKLAKYALQRGDQDAFLQQINGSGLSSEKLLENITYEGDLEPKLAQGLAFCRSVLAYGAIRVQGGGFAGTIMAVIPDEHFELFLHQAQDYFGPSNVREVSIVASGIARVELVVN